MSRLVFLLAFPLGLLLQGPDGARAEPGDEAGGGQGRRVLDADAVRRLVGELRQADAAIQDYTMVMVKQERFGDELQPPQRLFLRWARPQRVYLRYFTPNPGREAIYDPGRSGADLIVHTGSFPDITLELDPYGDLATAGSHYPIPDVSLHTFARIMSRNLGLLAERGDGRVEVAEETLWSRPVVHLWFEMPRGGREVALREGETLWDLARRLGRDMYELLHANCHRGWDEADDPEPGDRVFVPTYYGSRGEVWLDAERMLPLKAVFWDHQGRLYERFEHHDLRLDQGVKPGDFDSRNPAYNF